MDSTLFRRDVRGTAAIVLLIVAVMIGPITAHVPAHAQGGDRQVVVGDVVNDTLDSTNYVQLYELPASAGDIISIDVSTENADLDPVLVLVNPNGLQLAEDSDSTTPEAANLTDVELPVTGTYTILVMRGNGAGSTASGAFTMRISGIQQVGGQTATLTQGGITFELTWNAAVDLNLEVRDPVGGTVHAFSPGSPSGGTLDADVNGNCDAAIADNPTETIGWPVGNVPAGSYEIIIYYQDACDVGGPQLFTISTSVDGDETQTITGTLNPGQEYLARMVLQPTNDWTLQNGGVNAGLDVNLFSNEIADAEPIAPGSAVFNTITNSRPAQAYSFDVTTGTIINVTQNAQSGSLDTYLVLLGPNNAPVASNDDANEDTTNSAIDFTAAADGTYTVLATRYGLTIGGTEGEYTLAITTGAEETTDATADATDTTDATPEPGSTLPDGAIEVRLTWLTNADLQLLVRDPRGDSVFDDEPDIRSGGVLVEDGNVGCVDTTATPVSYIYWPNQLPLGTYEVEVWYQNSCEDTRPVNFGLDVEVQNENVFSNAVRIEQGARFMVTFTIGADYTVTVGEAGLFDMANPDTLNFVSQLPFATPIAYGGLEPGTITLQQKYQVFSFEGEQGDAIRIAMEAQQETLDPALYLVYQDGTGGTLTIAANDDVEPGLNSNSLIEVDALPTTGTYYIIATHYGLHLGGTSGSFELALQQQ